LKDFWTAVSSMTGLTAAEDVSILMVAVPVPFFSRRLVGLVKVSLSPPMAAMPTKKSIYAYASGSS
jgi:hypothetical protein